jgi:hypothetical protein
MENTCPTVKIAADNEQGFVVINESDFDPKTQAIYGADPVEDEPKRRGRPPAQKGE